MRTLKRATGVVLTRQRKVIEECTREPLTVAVWGSSALDRLVDSCFPKLATGDKVGIIYVGEKGTRRGLNPVKLFALKVLRTDGKIQTANAA